MERRPRYCYTSEKHKRENITIREETRRVHIKTSNDTTQTQEIKFRKLEFHFKPFGAMRRIENETRALEFLSNENKIPTPTIIAKCEKPGHRCLVTLGIPGIKITALEDVEDYRTACAEMKEIQERFSSIVRHEASTFLPDKRLSFRPNQCVYLAYARAKEFPFSESGYQLCHGDLFHTNIIVDPMSARVKGIIDWEYSGFFPTVFDDPRYYLECKKFGEVDMKERTQEVITFVKSGFKKGKYVAQEVASSSSSSSSSS